MTSNRIELEGRLAGQPELRVTPAGTPVLHLIVECGGPGEQLRIGVVMTGDGAAAVKPLLVPGGKLRVIGRLRQLKAAAVAVGRERGLEVVAESVEPGSS